MRKMDGHISTKLDRLLVAYLMIPFMVSLTEFNCWKYLFTDYCLEFYHLVVCSAFPTYLQCGIICVLLSWLVFVSLSIESELIWIMATFLCVWANGMHLSVKLHATCMSTMVCLPNPTTSVCSLVNFLIQKFIFVPFSLHMGGHFDRGPGQTWMYSHFYALMNLELMSNDQHFFKLMIQACYIGRWWVMKCLLSSKFGSLVKVRMSFLSIYKFVSYMSLSLHGLSNSVMIGTLIPSIPSHQQDHAIVVQTYLQTWLFWLIVTSAVVVLCVQRAAINKNNMT